jgi:hypothetical protein
MNTIKMQELLPVLKPWAAIGHRNLTLVLLAGGGARFHDYLLVSEAVDAELLTVKEVDESGSVSEALAVNDAERLVLLIDGEELQGAKQNRILNTSVLLPPKSKTRIPVSCVEEGRWDESSPVFQSGHYSPGSLRKRKSVDVQRSLRAAGRAKSDQAAVWDCVSEQIDDCKAEAPSGALADAVNKSSEKLKRYRQALPYQEGTCGVVASIRGRFAAADIFDSPSTLEVIWPRLVDGYAMDAERAKSGAAKTFSTKAADLLLERIPQLQWDAFESVGLGRDMRCTGDEVVGQALAVGKHLLHLSLFPQGDDRDGEEMSETSIRPPSQRKK